MEGKLFVGQYLILLILLLGQLHGYISCIEKERVALLDLKKYTIESNESDQFLTTWTNVTKSDCCQWEKVKCDRTSGRVIKLSIGWAHYRESSLNLSLLHPFEEVHILDLSESGFSGLFDDVEGYKSLRRLRNLEILDLSRNAFNNSIFPFINAATSLITLLLGLNNMDGLFPAKELKDLMNLELLDLSENRFNNSIPLGDLPALRNLKALDLHGNKFSTSMELQGICELKNLEELNLSQNKLVGQFPFLCFNGLRVLDLSSNQLNERLPSAIRTLESLEYMSLSNNSFKGSFSLGLLANLSKLRVFRLDSKGNSLQVESGSSWKPKFQLNVIALPSCNLKKVPHFLLHQKDLRHVDLSDNNISGTFPSWLLVNNTKLENLHLQSNLFKGFQLPETHHNLQWLDLSVNKLTGLLPEKTGWIFPHLLYMNISKNGFEGNLPSSLGNMRSIEYLDLSHNSFQGKLPRALVEGCYSLVILKLSYNKLSGEIFQESVSFTGVIALFLDNNHFTGQIGHGLRRLINLVLLDISNNNLTGVIPSWIGELPTLFSLLLSNNSLEGEIPISLVSISSIRLLDLSANSLYGPIPPHVSSGTSVVLLLKDNYLSGVLPNTLLLNVSLLDLRNNRFSGNVPEFISNQRISFLLLRGNNLTGRIPSQLCALTSIHLLDLANNRLSGSIPSCLSNISSDLRKVYTPIYDFGIHSQELSQVSYLDRISISTRNVGIYFKSLLILDQFKRDEYDLSTQTSIEFATKDRFDAYRGGNLGYLFGIDLSENELSGEIPVELGGLKEFHALNLSHNSLSGAIPESFSGLKNMESLDLSYNRLQGRIPPQLAELSSLAVFNVSYNNLLGAIPLGRQFNTFDTRSYLGNPLLCGKPTNTSCDSNNFQEADDGEEADESTIDIESFYWSLVAAYVTTTLIGIFASFSFDSPWKRFWFDSVDAFIYKVRSWLW